MQPLWCSLPKSGRRIAKSVRGDLFEE